MPPRPPYRMHCSHSGSTVDSMADRTSADRTHPCAQRPRELWHATTHSRQAMERRLSARAAPYDGAAAAAAGPARAQHRSAPSHLAFCPTRPSDSRPQRSAAARRTEHLADDARALADVLVDNARRDDLRRYGGRKYTRGSQPLRRYGCTAKCEPLGAELS